MAGNSEVVRQEVAVEVLAILRNMCAEAVLLNATIEVF